MKTEKTLGKIVSNTLAFALNVGRRLFLSTLLLRDTAGRVVKIERTDESASPVPVFDLTVEPHHCYMANGLLVSNSNSSDAWQILAVGMKKAMGAVGGMGVGAEDDGLIGLSFDDERPVTSEFEMDAGVF